MKDQFKFQYDKKNELWHVEIKGIPFTFSREEMKHLEFVINVELLESDENFQRYAEAENKKIEESRKNEK